MAQGNTVTLVGNITRDPELRFTNAGMAIASFGLAVNDRRQKNGEWEEQTSFFDITCFGQMGENAAESLNKGSRILVTGRLQQRSWETQDGQKRSKVEVVADEIGPSLRWATAEVVRSERREGGDGGGGGPRPVTNAPSGNSGGGNSGGGNSGGGNSGGGDFNYDEEPF